MSFCVTGNYSIQNCLGVGTATPSYGVDVRGTGVGTAAIALNNTSANGREWAIYSTGNNFSQGCGGLLFYRAWTDAASGTMYLDCLGRVGIGTTSPGYKLTISDTAATKLSLCGGTVQNGITFEKAGSGCSYYIFNGDYANLCGFGIYNVSTTALPLFINNSSYVGINTATPSDRLSVNGGQGQIQLRVDTSDGSTINVRPNSGRCGWISYTEDAVADRWGIGIKNGDAKLYFSSGNVASGGGTTRMVLDGSGNLVVNGTDGDPLTNGGTFKNLVVYGGAGYGVVDLMTTATAANSTVGSFAGGTTGASGAKFAAAINIELDGSSTTTGVGRLVFYTTGNGAPAERMRITCAGNIGIGISTPCAPLSFNNVEGNKIDFYYTAAGSGDRYGIQVQSSELRIHSGAAGACTGGITFGKQSTSTFTEAMRVTNAGCVGIGTATPSYRLHVNGTFYAAGSSIKYKEGICNYDTDSCLFMCLKPVTYQYKDEWQHLGRELKSQSQIGLIAEDVAEVMPELAVLVNEEDEKVVRNVDYEKLSVVLLKEVQKLRLEVDQLKNNK